MMQKVMVTGASGFLGKTLVEKLLRQPSVKVVAVCRTAGKCRHLPAHNRLITRTFDLEQPATLLPVFLQEKPRIVFHLGAIARLQSGEQEPEKTVAVNLLGSLRLLEIAAQTGVKKILFTSSDLARNAQSVVGITKLLMENYIQLYPHAIPETVGFRMPNLYGFPGSVMDIFARQIARDQDLTITDERMARRFLTRDEAADYLLYLSRSGLHRHIYSVNQEPIYIKDLAQQMIAASEKPLKLKVIGARPGEKLYEASYSEKEAKNIGFQNLSLLRLPFPAADTIFPLIRKLPVSVAMKAKLQNAYENLF
jgi:FlaA1/EpsC-like NDP-sugar epimerase